jgi:hypothetical protein
MALPQSNDSPAFSSQDSQQLSEQSPASQATSWDRSFLYIPVPFTDSPHGYADKDIATPLGSDYVNVLSSPFSSTSSANPQQTFTHIRHPSSSSSDWSSVHRLSDESPPQPSFENWSLVPTDGGTPTSIAQSSGDFPEPPPRRKLFPGHLPG